MLIFIVSVFCVIFFVIYNDLKTYGKYNKYGGKKAIISTRGVPPFGLGLDFIFSNSTGKMSNFEFKELNKIHVYLKNKQFSI